MLLALFCAFAEAKFYRAIVERISPRIGRYTLLALFSSVGMYQASIGNKLRLNAAFLPSSFTMCVCMLAFSYAFQGPRDYDDKYVYLAVVLFALSGVVWPFSGLIALPFAVSELAMKSRFASSNDWRLHRVARMVKACILGLGVVVRLCFNC